MERGRKGYKVVYDERGDQTKWVEICPSTILKFLSICKLFFIDGLIYWTQFAYLLRQVQLINSKLVYLISFKIYQVIQTPVLQ